MFACAQFGRWSKFVAAGSGVAILGLLLGAKPQEASKSVSSQAAEEVDLFAAIEAGQLEARLILQDEFQGKVLLRNQAGKPLDVRLPEVLAGVPVLGQNVGIGNIFGPDSQGNSGQPQPVGGGINLNGGDPNAPAAGALFNVPAERVAQLSFRSVCLEHGKVSPRAVMKYRLVPLAQVSGDPAMAEVLKLYLRGHCNQKAAQAAAWHFANHMSWDQLAAMQVRRATGARSPYFTTAGLQEAKRLAARWQPADDSPHDSLATQAQ